MTTSPKESDPKGKAAGRILFYAMGSGLGHLTRTHSLVRKLKTLFKGELAVLTNSSYSQLFDFSPFRLKCIDTSCAGGPSVKETVESFVKDFKPDILVVDTFPRGLAGELVHFLPELSAKKVLIERFLKEDYIRRFSVSDFIENNFDYVISVEPVKQHDPEKVPTSLACPVLQRDCDELPSRESARGQIGLAGQNRLILCVIERMQRKDASLYTLLCKVFSLIKPRGFELRFASINKAAEEEDDEDRRRNPLFISHFPLVELLPAVDILIGPSGYNLYHESKSLSIASLYLPQKMMYDDQIRRAAGEGISSPDALLERLSALIDKVRNAKEKKIDYVNEASRAASLIVDLLPSGR